MDFISISPSDDDLFKQDQDHHSPSWKLPRHLRTWDPASSGPKAVQEVSELKKHQFRLIHGPYPAWFISPQHSRLPIVRPTNPQCLPAHLLQQQRENEEYLEQKFAVEDKSNLPPLFWQHWPNNSLVATLPCSGEISRPAFISKITLQKNLKDKGIVFHQTGNKAKLFSTLMSACSISTSSLPGEVVKRTPTRRDTPIKGTVQSNTTAQRQHKSSNKRQTKILSQTDWL